MRRIRFLKLQDAIRVHDSAIQKSGGGLMGLRDLGLLDSAVNYPKMLYAMGGSRDLYELAAAYGDRIIKNHAFVDGNKRTGVLMMAIFLDLNGIVTHFNQEELYKLVIEVAQSKKGHEDLALYLKKSAPKNQGRL